MQAVPIILVAEDDEGHAILMRENLEAGGLTNPIEHFRDGQAILDFLFERGPGRKRDRSQIYLVLLDIRMPKVDGVEVLRQIKANPALRDMPVVMLTTTDDIREVERCYRLGCNVYIRKPIAYEQFAEAVRKLGMFIPLVQIPPVLAH
jgi:CheY-like chemotaxis protein